MTDPATTGPDRSRKLRLIISLAAAGLILAVLTGVGIYGLISGPPTSRPGTTEPTGPAIPAPTVPSSPTPGRTELPALPETRLRSIAVADALCYLELLCFALEAGDQRRIEGDQVFRVGAAAPLFDGNRFVF